MEVIGKINANIINPLIYLLFVLGLVYFLYGMFQFIYNAESDAKRNEGKQHMVWGVIGMVIMVGAFGILNIINNTIGSLMKK